MTLLKHLVNWIILIFFYSSDHGYHLGQFGLGLDKRLPYEFDLRVPFFVIGPNVPKGVNSSALVSSVDFAPTFLDIAQINLTIANMDGQSLLPLLTSNRSKDQSFRSELLVEYFGESNLDGAADGNCPHAPGVTGYENGPEDTVTPPKYTGPSFCSGQDARNNTYSCLRVFNSTTNQLYCEFVDSVNFVELFDISKDPYELKNIATVVTPDELRRLHQDLQQIEKCHGSTYHTSYFSSGASFSI